MRSTACRFLVDLDTGLPLISEDPDYRAGPTIDQPLRSGSVRDCCTANYSAYGEGLHGAGAGLQDLLRDPVRIPPMSPCPHLSRLRVDSQMGILQTV